VLACGTDGDGNVTWSKWEFDDESAYVFGTALPDGLVPVDGNASNTQTMKAIAYFMETPNWIECSTIIREVRVFVPSLRREIFSDEYAANTGQN